MLLDLLSPTVLSFFVPPPNPLFNTSQLKLNDVFILLVLSLPNLGLLRANRTTQGPLIRVTLPPQFKRTLLAFHFPFPLPPLKLLLLLRLIKSTFLFVLIHSYFHQRVFLLFFEGFLLFVVVFLSHGQFEHPTVFGLFFSQFALVFVFGPVHDSVEASFFD